MAKIVRKEGNVNIAKIMRELDALQSRVGWFEAAKYTDGTPVAYIASIHEYGYPEGGIPARSFFRPAIEANRQAWINNMRGAAKKVADGSITPYEAMEFVTSGAEGDIRKSLTSVNSPPLKESTLRARAHRDKVPVAQVSTKPLNDTGHMLATLTSQVERK